MNTIHIKALVFTLVMSFFHTNHLFANQSLVEVFKEWATTKEKNIGLGVADYASQISSLESKKKDLESKLLNAKQANLPLTLQSKMAQDIEVCETQLTVLDSKLKNFKEGETSFDYSSFLESPEYQSYIENSPMSEVELAAFEEQIQTLDVLKLELESMSNLADKAGIDIATLNKNSLEDLNITQQTAYKDLLAKKELLDSKVASVDVNLLNEVSSFSDFESLTQVVPANVEGFNRVKTKVKKDAIDLGEEKVDEITFIEKPMLQDQLFFESDLTWLSSDKNIVNVSPLLGYRVSKRFSFGLGTSYQNLSGINEDLTGTWSGRLMTRVYLFKDIFSFQMEGVSPISALSESQFIDYNKLYPLLGGRLALPSTSKLPLNMTFMHSPNSEVANPAALAPWQMKLGLTF